MSDGEDFPVPSTIDDPAILTEIRIVLQDLHRKLSLSVARYCFPHFVLDRRLRR